MKKVGTPTILIVDEINNATKKLASTLRGAGYFVDVLEESEQIISTIRGSAYQIIILNEKLPNMNGMDVCRQLRQNGVTIPILMISASTQKVSLIRCLELGADDYLVQPFNYNELVARIRALMRRENKDFASQRTAKGGLSLDLATYNVGRYDNSIKLTKKEALLLRRLMLEAPRTVSREMLLQDVWGIDDLHTSNRLDVYVRRLRWKLEQLSPDNLIHTVRGNGYYFSQELDDEADEPDRDFEDSTEGQGLSQTRQLDWTR